jgi:uncharacterized protein
MNIHIKVNTSSKHASIELSGDVYIVKFKATREKGKANDKLIRLLADYFKVPKSQIKIIRGEFATNKVVQIS